MELKGTNQSDSSIAVSTCEVNARLTTSKLLELRIAPLILSASAQNVELSGEISRSNERNFLPAAHLRFG